MLATDAVIAGQCTSNVRRGDRPGRYVGPLVSCAIPKPPRTLSDGIGQHWSGRAPGSIRWSIGPGDRSMPGISALPADTR